ncbi:hypothetical protein EV702DRAFT_981768, partial [Suillus placidus]
RVLQVTAEFEMAKTGCQDMHDTRQDTNLATNRFYGVSPFVFSSISLPFDLTYMLNLLHTQDEYIKLKTKKLFVSKVKDHGFGAFVDPLSIELKMGPTETIQKQTVQYAAEFDCLARKYNEVTRTRPRLRGPKPVRCE